MSPFWIVAIAPPHGGIPAVRDAHDGIHHERHLAFVQLGILKARGDGQPWKVWKCAGWVESTGEVDE